MLIDDIKTFREFPLRNSRVCRFSCGGHLLAAVSEKDIAVYSTINFKRVVSESLSIVVLIELYYVIHYFIIKDLQKKTKKNDNLFTVRAT